MKIQKLVVVRPKSKTVYEVLCRYGANHINFRATFDDYRSASKFCRDQIRDGYPAHRFEIREVVRLDILYGVPEKPSLRPVPRVIEDVFEKTWDLKKRTAKRGGSIVRS